MMPKIITDEYAIVGADSKNCMIVIGSSAPEMIGVSCKSGEALKTLVDHANKGLTGYGEKSEKAVYQDIDRLWHIMEKLEGYSEDTADFIDRYCRGMRIESRDFGDH